jgi:hypothetical protein
LNGNLFTGAIPSDVVKLTELRVLDLNTMQLTGTIPDVGSLTDVSHL